jgi:hypothetical protein
MAVDFTEDEKKILRHEAFLAEVLRLRRPANSGDKPRWQRFLESTGGAALITVVLGGLAGGIITHRYQQKSKEKELALVAYKEYLDQEQETARRAYEIIGNCVSSSENLIILTSPAFDLDRFTGADRNEVKKKVVSLREQYNNSDAQWRSEREKLRLLFAYYHPGQPKIVESWSGVQQSLTDYMGCARTWQNQHPKATDDDSRSACLDEKKALGTRLDDLSRSLQESRHYAWQTED